MVSVSVSRRLALAALVCFLVFFPHFVVPLPVTNQRFGFRVPKIFRKNGNRRNVVPKQGAVGSYYQWPNSDRVIQDRQVQPSRLTSPNFRRTSMNSAERKQKDTPIYEVVDKSRNRRAKNGNSNKPNGSPMSNSEKIYEDPDELLPKTHPSNRNSRNFIPRSPPISNDGEYDYPEFHSNYVKNEKEGPIYAVVDKSRKRSAKNGNSYKPNSSPMSYSEKIYEDSDELLPKTDHDISNDVEYATIDPNYVAQDDDFTPPIPPRNGGTKMRVGSVNQPSASPRLQRYNSYESLDGYRDMANIHQEDV